MKERRSPMGAEEAALVDPMKFKMGGETKRQLGGAKGERDDRAASSYIASATPCCVTDSRFV